jgi:hypothetical protein
MEAIMIPLYEVAPRYDAWIKAVLAAVLLTTLVLGFVLLPVSRLGAWMMFAVTAFDALLFHWCMPRMYQVFPDRLRIVLGRPFAMNIPLEDITDARPGHGSMALAYMGHRFSPSTKTVVEIVRSRGWNVVISPDDRDAFLLHLSRAREAHRGTSRSSRSSP